MDYKDYTRVSELIGEAQDADNDLRDKSREARLFLDKPDGQWEQGVWSRLGRDGRPRYTFDKCNPIVNQISGEIKKADFDIKVKPAGGEASKETAKLFDGMIRNIENISNANHVFNRAAKNMIATGIDGWMVVQDWCDTESFDQDLFIKPIPNFIDSVWFDPNSQEQDRSDAMWAVKLTAMTKDAYYIKWPDGSCKSVSQDRNFSSWWQKAEQVIVGEFYWVEMVDQVLIRMNNGAVYTEENIAQVADELAQAGIVEKDRRTRKKRVVKMRHLDGGGWLSEEQDTVFSWIPIIPTYANFNVTENKLYWRGAVEKLIDPQRVYNYARSRQIEEGALAPKEKLMMTRDQAEGEENTLRTMNTNNNPVQFYNHVDGQPAPYKMPGAQINQGLEVTANSANNDITQGSGLFAANMGDNPALQSGVAIEQLQERGDTSTIDYFESQEIAICHTAKILVDAIPKVYDTERQTRILNEDGTIDMQQVNQPVIDNQTGQVVTLNDLSRGRYDVTCDVGKSFKNRQQESVAAIIEMAQIDPTVIQEGGDILLRNTNAPGLDLIAERKRQQLLNAGLIPESQWSDEEREQIAQAQAMAAQQPQQPSPEMVLAQAEMTKAQADMAEAQLKQQGQQLRAIELQQKQQQIDAEIQLKSAEIQQSGQKDSISAAQKQQEFDLQIQQMQQDLALKLEENDRKNAEAVASMQQAQQDFIKTQAETLKTLKDAMGVDAIVGPSNTEAYQNQASEVAQTTDSQ